MKEDKNITIRLPVDLKKKLQQEADIKGYTAAYHQKTIY